MALSTSDPWYRAEVTAPAIDALAAKLRAAFPGAEVGTRGDAAHVRGYHRSRNFCLHSPYCPDGSRAYSTSETPGNRSGGNGDWVCALDFGVPQATLLAVCKRVDEAVRAGRLEKITEWYGNLDGDTRVDGYNNIANRLATSDSSHLFHLHLSFDRGRANEDHSDVLAVMMGVDDVSDQDVVDGLNRTIDFRSSGVAAAAKAVGMTGKSTRELIEYLFKAVVLDAPTRDAALSARLDAILAAASDDGDVTVQMDDASRAELKAIRDALAASAHAAADKLDGTPS